MSRILQVFNRYIFMGGEEKSVDRIYRHLGESHEMERCFFESKDWTGENAPGKLQQLSKTFYNRDSKRRFEETCDTFKPDAVMFHNIFPVGSPSLFHAAKERGLPVIQYVHNFRPFSVGGTLYGKGKFLEKSLQGNYWPEIRAGAWQGSVLKTAILALVLKRLHRSGWLENVAAWVCISDFIRQKFIAAALPPERVFSLRHSWDALPESPAVSDQGYYLYLARLVEEKGVDVLLKTWRKLEEKLGDATPELWIGGEGPLENVVKEAAAQSKKIRFLGLINGEEKVQTLQNCRALLAPSTWWEPLGLVTYEAYDYRKPVLAAASGGLTETVHDGVTGFLHKPGNVEEFAASVIKMESLSAAERQSIGDAGRDWLLNEASVSGWKREFDQILAKVVQ